MLCRDAVSWTSSQRSRFHARFEAHGEIAEIDYVTDDSGALQSVSMPRWGNPEGAEFHLASFGGFVEESATFGGYAIPVRMRVGWNSEDFFRVTIDDAVYR